MCSIIIRGGIFFIFGFFVRGLMEFVGEIKIVLNGCFEFMDKDFRGFVFGGEIWSNLYFMDCIIDFIFEVNLREGILMVDYFYFLLFLSGLLIEVEWFRCKFEG